MAIRSSRASALAGQIAQGRDIEAFIHRPEIAKRLVEASEDGVPAVSGISGLLSEEFGLKTFANPATRKFVGVVIRPVMEQRGFLVVKRNVPVRGDPIFKSGAVYGRPRHMSPPRTPLLKRFLDCLSESELDWVASYVARTKSRPRADAMRDGESNEE
jgi:hypothetical protein